MTFIIHFKDGTRKQYSNKSRVDFASSVINTISLLIFLLLNAADIPKSIRDQYDESYDVEKIKVIIL